MEQPGGAVRMLCDCPLMNFTLLRHDQWLSIEIQQQHDNSCLYRDVFSERIVTSKRLKH
jgi:hypothetical protein